MFHFPGLARALRGNPNFQAPNYKQYPMTKILNSKRTSFRISDFEFWIYLGFGICDLEFLRKARLRGLRGGVSSFGHPRIKGC